MTSPAGKLAFIDAETTGLDTRLHDVIEVAWAIGDQPISHVVLPHTLDHASAEALKVNKYFERGLSKPTMIDAHGLTRLASELRGTTIVACNYGFDVAMLTKKIGWEPWHYRKIELSSVAMMMFNDFLPRSLMDIAEKLRKAGWEIPEPDHSAEADVECLRACYYALRAMRNGHSPQSELEAVTA